MDLLCVIKQPYLTIGKTYKCDHYTDYIYRVYTNANKWKYINVWVNISKTKEFKWVKCLVSQAEYRDLQIDKILE